VFARVGAKRLRPTEAQIANSVSLAGQSRRTMNWTEIEYGRWVRKGNAKEHVCAIDRFSDESAIVKRNNRRGSIC
jgi:hypothetical protein